MKSEFIKIHLRSFPYGISTLTLVRHIIPLLSPDVKDHTDGEEIEVPDRDPDLYTPKKEKRSGHLAAADA